MDFLNSSFDRFQDQISRSYAKESLLWELRDGLFSTLTHDQATIRKTFARREMLLWLPFGWMLYLVSFGLMRFRNAPKKFPPPATHQVLCLSTRSNHMKRILPLLREFAAKGSCVAWVVHPGVPALVDTRLRPHLADVAMGWIPCLRFEHILSANKEVTRLKHCLDESFPRLQWAKCRIYLAIYFACMAFWESKLSAETHVVATTYEKDPMAKAFLAVAKSKGVKQRIHWTHGLPHNSQQATFASELWCLTKPDVEYFQSVLPDGCRAIYRPSPEAVELAENTGVLSASDLATARPVHFLFLGGGLDATYSRTNNLEDLSVLKAAASELERSVRWRFRPHPGNRSAFLEDLASLSIKDVEISSQSLEEDIRWSHAVGTVYSSVAIDASSSGRPLFWVMDPIRSLYSVDRLIASGLGIHINQANAAEKIRSTFQLGRPDQSER